MALKTIIGLEIHVELSTASKMFCSCKNEFGQTPNTNVCEVCLGHPGALPSINKKALEYAIQAGLAFDCTIRKKMKMDRKKYFYPDLVKGFQITQEAEPLCEHGHIDLRLPEGEKRVRIRRIHIEEDTGKSIHDDNGNTLLDYNRSGVPLIEIVTEPDMNHPEEGRLFLEMLKQRLKYLGISDVKMEEGSLRCDINLNVVDENTSLKTKISEIKNLNSFKTAVKAMEYEEQRHQKLLKDGLPSEKETRRWDEVSQSTLVMRHKEEGNDYRFSIEGDIPFIYLNDDYIAEIRKALPELPHVKCDRFMRTYGLDAYEAEILAQNQILAQFYETVNELVQDPKLTSNWIISDVLRQINDSEIEIADMKMNPVNFAKLLNLVKNKSINQNTGKKLLRELFQQDFNPDQIVRERGLIQITDDSALEGIVRKVLAENPNSIADFKKGKDRALGFLVGQAMKQAKGKGNPQKFNQMLKKALDESQ